MNGELCIRSAKVSDAGRIMRLINELCKERGLAAIINIHDGAKR